MEEQYLQGGKNIKSIYVYNTYMYGDVRTYNLCANYIPSTILSII